MNNLVKNILLFLFTARIAAQPYSGPNPIAEIGFGSGGGVDFTYLASLEQVGDRPSRWLGGFAIAPVKDGKFLRNGGGLTNFSPGELISSASRVYTNVVDRIDLPPINSYDLVLLSYSAVLGFDWQYAGLSGGTFAGATNVILGVRVPRVDGNHYGWIELTRLNVDGYTSFVVKKFAMHPLAEEGVLAGQLPPLPEVAGKASDGSLRLTWDVRWGPLVVETSDSLPANHWRRLEGAYVGGVEVDEKEEARFFRLAWP